LASKPLGQFVSDLTSVSPDLALKPVVTVFSQFGLKTGGDGFLDLDLKTGS
jgi:hypothetical protein